MRASASGSSSVIVPMPSRVVDRRVGRVHSSTRERLVVLVERVAVHVTSTVLRRLARGEGERPGRGGVVGAGGRGAVGGRVVDRHRVGARLRERDREGGGRGPGVALRDRDVADGRWSRPGERQGLRWRRPTASRVRRGAPGMRAAGSSSYFVNKVNAEKTATPKRAMPPTSVKWSWCSSSTADIRTDDPVQARGRRRAAPRGSAQRSKG